MCEFDVIKPIPNWPGYLASPDGQILDGFDGHNAQDMVVHGTNHLLAKNRRSEITHGYESKHGENHPRSKLSDQKRRLIYSSYYGGGRTQQELADQFGMSVASIGRIVNDNRWGETH